MSFPRKQPRWQTHIAGYEFLGLSHGHYFFIGMRWQRRGSRINLAVDLSRISYNAKCNKQAYIPHALDYPL